MNNQKKTPVIFTMLVGLPGSGKSTIAAEKVSARKGDTIWISSDAIRGELYGDENCQDGPRCVFDEMTHRAIAVLCNGYSVIYDATNLIAKKRKKLIEQVRRNVDREVEMQCIVVVTTIEECVLRQSFRGRQVPEEVIWHMAKSFEAPYYNEGWDEIEIFQNGPLYDLMQEHDALDKTPHDNPHHSLDIGEHCWQACLTMNKRLRSGDVTITATSEAVLCAAAYNHDIGKRLSKDFHDHKGNPTKEAHYYGHQSIGAYLWCAKEVGGHTDFKDEHLLAAALIQWHMIPYSLKEETQEATMQWARSRGFTDTFGEWLWLLHEVDRDAH